MTEFKPYWSEAEIEDVVRRFESCEFKPEEFFHARHLTVAAWYFLHFDEKTASERMRAGLVKFIRHHGKNGYHETITEFWLRSVRDALRETEQSDGLVMRVNRVVAALDDKHLIYEYYSHERVDSAKAKAGWVEPDLKALPGIG
jgi:hypothetical protein